MWISSWRHLTRGRAIGRVIIYPADLVMVIIAAWGIRWLSVDVWRSASIDVHLYATYARHFWLGTPAWSALPQEYPPLALLAFSLALVPPGWNIEGAFTFWLALAFVGGYLLTLAFAGRLAALLFLLYLFLGAAAFIVARYDLLPALCTLGALFALQRARFRVAGALLVMGGLLKIYPWFLLPLVLMAAWRATVGTPGQRLGQVARWGMAPAALLGAGVIIPWLLNAHTAFSAITNAAQRPVQVESFWSLIVWGSTWFGHPIVIDFTYGSHNWLSPLSVALAQATTPLMVIGCLAIAGAYARGWLILPQAFLASVVAIVLLNRVFSTQYLIWLLPLIAVVEGLDVLWVLICIATSLGTFFYPFNAPFTVGQLTQFMLIMLVRNGLLVVAMIRICWRQRPAPETRSAVVVKRQLQTIER